MNRGASGGSRTPNLQIRSLTLYPLSYGRVGIIVNLISEKTSNYLIVGSGALCTHITHHIETPPRPSPEGTEKDDVLGVVVSSHPTRVRRPLEPQPLNLGYNGFSPGGVWVRSAHTLILLTGAFLLLITVTIGWISSFFLYHYLPLDSPHLKP